VLFDPEHIQRLVLSIQNGIKCTYTYKIIVINNLYIRDILTGIFYLFLKNYGKKNTDFINLKLPEFSQHVCILIPILILSKLVFYFFKYFNTVRL